MDKRDPVRPPRNGSIRRSSSAERARPAGIFSPMEYPTVKKTTQVAFLLKKGQEKLTISSGLKGS